MSMIFVALLFDKKTDFIDKKNRKNKTEVESFKSKKVSLNFNVRKN